MGRSRELFVYPEISRWLPSYGTATLSRGGGTAPLQALGEFHGTLSVREGPAENVHKSPDLQPEPASTRATTVSALGKKLLIDTALRARFYGVNEEGARCGILFSRICEDFFARLRQSFASAASERAASRVE